MGGLSAGHIFGYASLLADANGSGALAELSGFRRFWGVATDNSRTVAGYKLYLLRRDGTRPAVGVAFMDVEPAQGRTVNGIVRPVGQDELEALDRRERNYDRIDVSDQIDVDCGGPIWTYRGSRAGRERLSRARAAGRAVVSRDYIDHVVAGFRAVGSEQQRAFRASSDLEGLPVWDLDRVDLPPNADRASEPVA